MQYFLDSADVDIIRTALECWPLDGVTTNPAILARDLPEGQTVAAQLDAIRSLTGSRLLFAQVTSSDTKGMIRDAIKLADFLGDNTSIKIPATPDGFAAMKQLAADGLSITATAVYSTSQALLAAKCGVDYAAPYISHLDNLSLDGPQVAADMAEELRFHGLTQTQILAASFRTAAQVERCIHSGVTAVTVTADMLTTLATHGGTAKECANFDAKWNVRFGKGIAEMI
ncbi:MAG: fructose-6-phosphate aldolase [Clostridia bacterium]|nr:fructose-6-phosphate aldolase [Clostridia bacterium]